MIFFKPTINPDNNNEILFEAIENETVSGKCTLKIVGNKAIVDYIDYDITKGYLVEGLLKSAFNYSVSKNCYMGYCKCENISHILIAMNFVEEDGVYFNDIPSILQGNCCKNYS